MDDLDFEKMKDIPFELLMKAKEDLNIDEQKEVKNKKIKKVFPKIKNNPLERDATIPLNRRMKFSSNKKKFVDPRFLETSGAFNETKFSKSYSFLKNIKEEENKLIRKELNNKKKKKNYSNKEVINLKNKVGNNIQFINKFKRIDEIKDIKQKLKTENNYKYIPDKLIKKEIDFRKFEKLSKDNKLESYVKQKQKTKDKMNNAIRKKISKK